MTDVAVPDLVIHPNGEEVSTGNPLDPCPACESRPNDAPEGVHDTHSINKLKSTHDLQNLPKPGDAKWSFEHCWKCGFRPGTNVAVSTTAMKLAFDKFKEMYAEDFARLAHHQGMAPPESDAEKEDLRQRLAAAEAQNTELRQQLGA